VDQNADHEWVIPCNNLTASMAFYTEQLGFRIDAIFPADAPRVAILSGCGSRICLQQSDEPTPPSPHSARIQFSAVTPKLDLPRAEPRFVINKSGGPDAWGEGRAGMLYRDLVPDRQGGGLIASHIRIPGGGPVPDYVHHHLVIFQVIYCYKGWVKVVYEDQGPEFTLREGDCVLQPPGIRHRVLECSDGMEVIELSAPAEHMTFVDHDLDLPTPGLNPGREFGGQNFRRHQARASDWDPDLMAGFEARETGVRKASGGVASLQVIRATGDPVATEAVVQGKLQLDFILRGSLELTVNGQAEMLAEGDVFVIPGGDRWSLKSTTPELELLHFVLFEYPHS